MFVLKLITFAIPCYHSAAYMRKCINSILAVGGDIEIIIIDDGSVTDDTAAIADEYEKQYPGICRAVHQENGGHGAAVNTGLCYAKGLYYKVVDSDDWLDHDSLVSVMKKITELYKKEICVDMVICNYVYEHVPDNTVKIVHYTNALPVDCVFSWDEVGHFHLEQNLLMHALIYRTQILRECGLALPKHTFYVDNLFAYIPLPYVKKMYYINVNLYRQIRCSLPGIVCNLPGRWAESLIVWGYRKMHNIFKFN